LLPIEWFAHRLAQNHNAFYCEKGQPIQTIRQCTISDEWNDDHRKIGASWHVTSIRKPKKEQADREAPSCNASRNNEISSGQYGVPRERHGHCIIRRNWRGRGTAHRIIELTRELLQTWIRDFAA
jgi:hypothetical protein